MEQLKGNKRHEDCPYLLRTGLSDNDPSPLSAEERRRFNKLNNKRSLTPEEEEEYSKLGSRWQGTVFPFDMRTTDEKKLDKIDSEADRDDKDSLDAANLEIISLFFEKLDGPQQKEYPLRVSRAIFEGSRAFLEQCLE